MNTVDSDRANNQTRDSRKRPRSQPGPSSSPKARPKARPKPDPQPDPKPKPTAKPNQRASPRPGRAGWFTIRDIIDEKRERGHTLYLIDWDGTDRDGRRYDPTWEPATNVTKLAINTWKEKQKGNRGKKKEDVSKTAAAPCRDEDPSPPETTQETDPVPAQNWRRDQRRPGLKYSTVPSATPAGDTGERAHKRRRTDEPPTPRAWARHTESRGQHQPAQPPAHLDTGDPKVNEPAQTRQVGATRGAQIVVELPDTLALDPSEFRIIPPSQAGQASSQATFLERMRLPGIDQRVIPDSQEISGTSISEAYNSHQEPADLFADSQLSVGPPAAQAPLEETSRVSPSPGIPSHQADPGFFGVSGYFANPNISTYSAANSKANQIQSLLHVTSTGPSQGPANEPSPVFQTQPERDFDIIAATCPVATSHSATIPSSIQQQANTHAFLEADSQQSHITNRDSTPSNSQAAQIVQPLSSHPGEATSQSQSDFSVFEEDRTVLETVPGGSAVQVDSQESSQALSELGSNIRISSVSGGHEPALPVPSPRAPDSARPGVNKPSPNCATVNPSQESIPRTPTNMNAAPATGAPLSAKERLRLFREGHFNSRSSVTGSISPAESSPAPLDNPPSVSITRNPTPQPEIYGDGEKSSTADMLSSLISPVLPIVSEAARPQTVASFQPAQANKGPDPPHDHVLAAPLSLDSYSAPSIEQPATLDPSALTLSIEKDVDGGSSVPTDDCFAPGPVLGSTNSGDEMQDDYPRSLLHHVPTGPCEYLVTLPFQTSSRPQYNDIIRENETLMNEYNAPFQVFPYETPRKDVVEKLDVMFSRLFDICDFPPFLDSLTSMSSQQITKHVIGTNAKFSFVAELLDNLRALNSDKKILILVRPGKLMDLLGYVIQSRNCRYIRSGREVVNPTNAENLLTVTLESTSDDASSVSSNVDVVIAFDHTFRHALLASSMGQSTSPIILTLVNTASIQHLNIHIMENLQPLERKNVLMLALVKAMRYVEEPDPAETLFAIAEKFARRIQTPEDPEDEFYWEPQSVPTEIFDDLYAASSQIDGTQLSGRGLGSDRHPSSRKRSHIDDDDDEGLSKRARMSQPEVITTTSLVSDAVRKLWGDTLAPGSEPGTVVVSVDMLQVMAEKFAEFGSKLEESKAREIEFRQLSDRAQSEVNGYVSSINKIQTRYMEALKERGIFEADCKTAQEQASVLSGSLDSCRAEIGMLKATRTELGKKLAEANEALLHSSNPNLIKMAELENNLNIANTEVQRLETKLILVQSEADYNKNLYNKASQRATELSAENRGYEKKIGELQRKADNNIIEVNKIQSRNEVRILAQQVKEQKNLVRERATELTRVKDELKSLKSGRRETRQSSVPRSPRLNSLGGVMSPRNGTRGPSAMGGPSSSRGTSPQPPVAVFDNPVGSGNGMQNAALLNQGPGASRFAHLRD
ncbi:putative hda1 complex protein [Rosellinia necatrix]|uniref:Putative hda1 complex protein n=1 Tax=Rosellinia necatrix TaxID=77044 RepID=A0A1S7ULG7_ROSNE|nr:putative hda1 complex protein [Rosellinia necatrix]